MIKFDNKSHLEGSTLEPNQVVITKGKFTLNDGQQASYSVITAADYGKFPDGDNEFYLANGNGDEVVAQLQVGQSRFKDGDYDVWNGTQWIPVDSSAGTDSNFPYYFEYPQTEREIEEMERNASNFSIGYGGSTWWTGPTSIGRLENGKPVVYYGSTYGTPENPQVEQTDFPLDPDDPNDINLYLNKRNGEAVATVTRLEFGDTPATTKYSITAFNKSEISYREDEHFQVAVAENTRLGQIMVAHGSRNSARSTIDGSNKRSVTQIAYGQDSNSLCETVEIDWSTQIDGDQMGYAYLAYIGNFGWQFSKAVDGDYWSATGSGGQFRVPNKTRIFENIDKNLVNPVNPDLNQTQTYLGFAWVDKWTRPNPLDNDYSRLQIFMANHPTTMTDTALYHLRGDFIPASVQAAPYDGGGVYLFNMSTGLPAFGVNGQLNSEPFDKTDMDTAYTPPVGKSCRLLDVAYTDAPRALVGVFDKPQDGDTNIPFGTTWDLVYVYWDGAAWQNLTIKAGIRGMLGYDPNQVTEDINETLTAGKEGFVSGYLNAACFYRGEDWNETELNPRIYYCGRDGDDRSKHYLAYQDLNASWDALSGGETRLVENSTKILYRPDMALGGPKRILFYQEADGWSSFNSWVAKTKFLDLTV